jgi:hypothetical protein
MDMMARVLGFDPAEFRGRTYCVKAMFMPPVKLSSMRRSIRF